MLYILFGEDTFSRDEALREIKDGLGDREFLSLNTSILDGQHLTWEQLTNTCNAVPFLSPVRLVVVEGLLAPFEPQGMGQRRRRRSPLAVREGGPWRGLKDFKPQMPPTTVLILVEGKLSRNNPLFKELIPVAEIREFRPLRGGELRRWVRSRISQLGGSISPTAVELLQEAIGSNLGLMAQEIEKLCLYASGRPIEDEDVRQLVSYAREANVFVMVDALMGRRQGVALRHLHQLLLGGATAPYILAMIARQVRLAIEAKEFSLKGLPTVEIGRRLGLASEYALSRTMEQARLYPMERLVAIHAQLLETDLAIKRGRYGEEMALELLVTGFG